MELVLVQVAEALSGVGWVINSEGRADAEPSAEGLAHVRAAGERLGSRRRVEYILAGPSLRARKSAAVLADALQARSIKEWIELGELHHGTFEARPFPELRRQDDPVFREFAMTRRWSTFSGGEGESDLGRRISVIFSRLAEEYAAEETVCVVTHGAIINGLVSAAIGASDPIFFMPSSGSISVILLGATPPTVSVLNDCSHLNFDPLDVQSALTIFYPAERWPEIGGSWD